MRDRPLPVWIMVSALQGRVHNGSEVVARPAKSIKVKR